MGLDLSGMNPETFTPFIHDGETVDEQTLRRHMEAIVEFDVSSLVCTDFAAEMTALTEREQLDIVELADEVTGKDTPIIAGCASGSTTGVTSFIDQLQAAGADGCLVMPPATTINHRADASVEFYEDIADTVNLPLIVFQNPGFMGGEYTSETLGEIARVDGVTAIKEAIWDIDLFQNDLEAVKAADSNVDVLVASDEHLLPCFSVGIDGSMIELGSVIPCQMINLFEQADADNLNAARDIYSEIRPFLKFLYSEAPNDSKARLKKVLELQGRFPNADMRAPAPSIRKEEIEELKRLLKECSVGFEPPYVE